MRMKQSHSSQSNMKNKAFPMAHMAGEYPEDLSTLQIHTGLESRKVKACFCVFLQTPKARISKKPDCRVCIVRQKNAWKSEVIFSYSKEQNISADEKRKSRGRWPCKFSESGQAPLCSTNTTNQEKSWPLPEGTDWWGTLGGRNNTWHPGICPWTPPCVIAKPCVQHDPNQGARLTAELPGCEHSLPPRVQVIPA